jgi:hypothetical protein
MCDVGQLNAAERENSHSPLIINMQRDIATGKKYIYCIRPAAIHSRPYTNLYFVRFEVLPAVLLKIWDVTLRGQAVQIILGLHDHADRENTVLLNVQEPLAQRHGVTSRETGNFNLHFIICIKEMTSTL